MTNSEWKNSVLICGIQKTGNTWTRFIIFNYFNILINGATKTLTFDELAKLHYSHSKHRNGRLINYPEIYHTHLAYDGSGFMNQSKHSTSKFFDSIDKLIYIYRNPLDTMISYHRFLFNRKEFPYQKIINQFNNLALLKRRIKLKKWEKDTRLRTKIKNLQERLTGKCDISKLIKLDDFTRYYLEKWIHHIKVTMHKADVILNYDNLRIAPIGFKEAIELTGVKIDMDIFKKAIEMSSFDNIRKMSNEENQPYGLGGPSYKGYFCRDGRTGQYKEIMNKELVEYIKNKCKEEEIEI